MARARKAASDESLASEWLAENPRFELHVAYLAIESQWLVAVYLVGSRQIHGWRAEPVGIGMNAELFRAMLQAIDEAERDG